MQTATGRLSKWGLRGDGKVKFRTLSCSKTIIHQMRNLLCLFLLILFADTAAFAQSAYTVETLPNPKAGGGRGYVSNPDGILGESDVNQLNTIIAALEDSATAQVAVAIVNSIGEENPKDFAYRLFRHWKVGQAGRDNGLLILSVIDQRRTEFETGYGLEAVLPDAICYRIGMQELAPYFREEAYGQGLLATLERIRATLEDPDVVAEIRSEGRSGARSEWLGMPVPLAIYLLVNLLFHLGLGIWVLVTLHSRQELYDKYLDVRKVTSFVFIIFFPIPYLLIYFGLRGLLRKLRRQPRYSRVNGKPMQLLSEKADDRFLEAGQVTEEEVGSVDYDVWVTEEEDDVLILRYARRFSKYRKCPKCRYRTYSVARTRVVKRATYRQAGKKEIVYACKNCRYSKTKYQTIPRKQRSGGVSIGGVSIGGGSGGGSSSWGGGSSGGGGAGVSW